MTQAANHSARSHSTENHYCHGCRATQSFLDRGDTLHCPRCQRTMTRMMPARAAKVQAA